MAGEDEKKTKKAGDAAAPDEVDDLLKDLFSSSGDDDVNSMFPGDTDEVEMSLFDDIPTDPNELARMTEESLESSEEESEIAARIWGESEEELKEEEKRIKEEVQKRFFENDDAQPAGEMEPAEDDDTSYEDLLGELKEESGDFGADEVSEDVDESMLGDADEILGGEFPEVEDETASDIDLSSMSMDDLLDSVSDEFLSSDEEVLASDSFGEGSLLSDFVPAETEGSAEGDLDDLLGELPEETEYDTGAADLLSGSVDDLLGSIDTEFIEKGDIAGVLDLGDSETETSEAPEIAIEDHDAFANALDSIIDDLESSSMKELDSIRRDVTAPRAEAAGRTNGRPTSYGTKTDVGKDYSSFSTADAEDPEVLARDTEEAADLDALSDLASSGTYEGAGEDYDEFADQFLADSGEEDAMNYLARSEPFLPLIDKLSGRQGLVDESAPDDARIYDDHTDTDDYQDEEHRADDDFSPEDSLLGELGDASGESDVLGADEENQPSEEYLDTFETDAPEEFPETPSSDDGVDDLLAELGDEQTEESTFDEPASDEGVDDLLSGLGDEAHEEESTFDEPASDEGVDDLLSGLGDEAHEEESTFDEPASDEGVDDLLSGLGDEAHEEESTFDEPASDEGVDDLLSGLGDEAHEEESTFDEPASDEGVDDLLSGLGDEAHEEESTFDEPASDEGVDDLLSGLGDETHEESPGESAAEPSQEDLDDALAGLIEDSGVEEESATSPEDDLMSEIAGENEEAGADDDIDSLLAGAGDSGATEEHEDHDIISDLAGSADHEETPSDSMEDLVSGIDSDEFGIDSAISDLEKPLAEGSALSAADVADETPADQSFDEDAELPSESGSEPAIPSAMDLTASDAAEPKKSHEHTIETRRVKLDQGEPEPAKPSSIRAALESPALNFAKDLAMIAASFLIFLAGLLAIRFYVL
ncbi:MAG: hypothetical protein NUW37_03340 [Planctomycetes bacterium]|nr:hypothetical protein [Planctomycetota bacterium]